MVRSGALKIRAGTTIQDLNIQIMIYQHNEQALTALKFSIMLMPVIWAYVESQESVVNSGFPLYPAGGPARKALIGGGPNNLVPTKLSPTKKIGYGKRGIQP